MQNFVHLHVHTEYSLLDGACHINDLIDAAASIGQKAIAITDHGNMYGVIDFYKAAKSKGIKPIIGCEVYTASRTRFDRVHEYDANLGHLILLAADDEGYKNLMCIVSYAYTQGFYIKPRVDEQLLREHSKGIIALSACLAGRIPQCILKDDYDGAKKEALKYLDIFGEGNFYLELQDHGILKQKKVNSAIIKISNETGIPLVATNDVHYIKKSDAQLHDVLMCIQMNKTVNDDDRFGFETQEFYLKSYDEMNELFSGASDAVSNTWEIAQRCNVTLEFGKLYLPEFKVPGGMDSFEYLKMLCEDGFIKRYALNGDLHAKLEYELETIKNMGFTDYFLIVNDFIKFARDSGIPVGPGRGSAAGSIVAYCLNITGVDPIKFGLIFERFLNPERISMPDIDIDFCYERRAEVIDYVKRKYGEDHVAQIITFGTMAARGAIRDVGRALDMPYADVDVIAKSVPMELHMTLSRALDVSPQLKEMYSADERVKRLIDTAKAAEGMPRHASTHAAGVVITKKPVHLHVPLAKNDESIVTQYTMNSLEELGLLKMDFLGLRTLTVINDACREISKRVADFDISKIDYEIPEVYKMIGNGLTEGVFQLESSGMKQVLIGLHPQNIEDIIAVISLYRPGPMDSIPQYIKAKNNAKFITYKHKLLEPILNVTYGCIVYQEQVMQIVRDIAGYSLGRADLVRRAMSKKKNDVMEKERRNFIYGIEDENGAVILDGAVRRGVSEKIAGEIFDDMSDFAKYAFNKSHATAYAVIAYQTAYLKCLYPCEFMAALLTSVVDSTDKIVGYIVECQKIGVKVLPPDINESKDVFSVVAGNIRFGLVAVKNIGRGFIKELMQEREKRGSFKSFIDFCERMFDYDLNKRALESLIKCGAFQSLGHYRSQLLTAYPFILDDIANRRKNNVEGQLDLFGNEKDSSSSNHFTLPDIAEVSIKDRLSMEKEVTGLYLSGHPMKEYQQAVKSIGALSSREILSSADSNPDGLSLYKDNDSVIFAGIVVQKKLKTTKNDSTMAFVNVEDMFGTIEIIVFPGVLSRYSDILEVDRCIAVKGHISIKEEDSPKLICEEAFSLDKSADPQNQPIKQDKPQKLYIRMDSHDKKTLDRVKGLFGYFSGKIPVYVYFTDTKELNLASKELWTDANDTLINELVSLLGKDNVKFK